jgi:Rieske 2Fe-2S family protein
VHEDAVEGVDYDIDTLIEVWRATNAQDATLVAHNQRGVNSKAYTPGPYAPSEFMLTNFTNWYAHKLGEHVARIDHLAGREKTIRLAVAQA